MYYLSADENTAILETAMVTGRASTIYQITEAEVINASQRSLWQESASRMIGLMDVIKFKNLYEAYFASSQVKSSQVVAMQDDAASSQYHQYES